MNVFFFFFLFFPGDTHYGGWMRMNDRESVKEGEREFVCSDLCSAPHRTYHYQMSQWGWLPAESLLIALNSNSLSLLLSLLLFSLLLSPFFFLPPLLLILLLLLLHAVFLERAQRERGEFSTNCFRSWEELGGQTPPSFCLSPLSLSSVSLPLSSPCCDRAHLLDLGYTRSESNYPIGPRSHSTVSSPPTRLDFLGVKLISPQLSSPRFYWEQVG